MDVGFKNEKLIQKIMQIDYLNKYLLNQGNVYLNLQP